MRDIVILDIGARGEIHPRWNRLADRLHAIAVDADRDAPIAKPAARRFEVFRFPLWKDERDVTLHITRNPGCSSFYAPNIDFLRRFPDAKRFDVLEHRSIHTQTLAAIDRQPDFIKLDTQGSELPILEGAVELLQPVIGIEVEVEFAPLYTNAPLFVDVDQFLRKHGFELCDLNRYYWRDLGDGQMRCIFADALYFKHPDLVPDTELAGTLARCYSLSLRQTLAHAYQWVSRWARPRRSYDADQQVGH